jgi:DNA (cytosine-5)-methyltransferase 1
MENVPPLLKAKTEMGEHVISIIERELREFGYHVYFDVLEAAKHGVPQIRKRLIVIGSKKKLARPFPVPTHAFFTNGNGLFDVPLPITPTLWEAISDLPELEARQGAEEMEYSKDADSDYQSLLRTGSTTLYNHKAMNHGKRTVERFAAMSCGDSLSDVPDHLKPLKRNGNGIISGKVYDQNSRRMRPNRPCHTIAASFYANFVHPHQHRNFTAREGARIQSFPDSFRFLGKPTVVSQKLLTREGRLGEKHLCQYNQIGNAVPPMLAKAIAENILDQV